MYEQCSTVGCSGMCAVCFIVTVFNTEYSGKRKVFKITEYIVLSSRLKQVAKGRYCSTVFTPA